MYCLKTSAHGFLSPFYHHKHFYVLQQSIATVFTQLKKLHISIKYSLMLPIFSLFLIIRKLQAEDKTIIKESKNI